jgi:hypothetical protein
VISPQSFSMQPVNKGDLMKRSLKLPSFVVGLFLAVSLSAIGQLTSGSVAGTAKDISGAVVGRVKVSVTNEATDITTTTTTNSSGEFQVLNLLPGVYDLKAEGGNFKPYEVKGISVDPSKTATVPVLLTVGAATATVEVTAGSGTTLDTTTTNLSTTFSTSELSTLPTATVGNGVLNTALLSPNVASSGAIGIGTGPSVGGQRPRNNNFTIEGIDNNDKGVTGPLVYVPNDAVADFTLITSQFSPEFGHSSGGQFNTNVISGTNHIHGVAYENFQNRELNAESGILGGKIPNPRYDFNRYGGEVGAPILKNKIFAFVNYERQTTGQNVAYYNCVPTATGLSTLQGLSSYNFSANNLSEYSKYTPTPNFLGGAQVTDANDNACFTGNPGPQNITVYSDSAYNSNTGVYGSLNPLNIPLGNQQVSAPAFENFWALTTSGDYTISSKDSLRLRYIYNKDQEINYGQLSGYNLLPAFFTPIPHLYHLIAISEYHNFTPNLTNEARLGYNRYVTTDGAGNFTYPGLDVFPNLTFDDLDAINYGPDPNAPQSTVQNMYQFTDNVSWTKGTHNFTIGFDGRKFIAPQTFTQRVRGDYEWDYLTEFLHDLAPTSFGQRSTGNFTYYGDQTALYGYANDTWRVTPQLTINTGLRYEFTSVPVGERAQVLNIAASYPGLISFTQPQPSYKSWAPRFGINYAPDAKTSIRAGFGIGYDVIFDNLGLLSNPPQYGSTNTVGDGNTNYTGNTNPNPGDPNFLGGYSNVKSAPIVHGLPPGNGGLTTYASVAAQRAATATYVPNQVVPYAESWNLQIQRTISNNTVATITYLGTRGIHLETQDQINKQPKATPTNQLFTTFSGPGVTGPTVVSTSANVPTYQTISALPNIVPAYSAAGFTSTITSYQPYSESNYNGLSLNLSRQLVNGLQYDISYTWSKTMDDATAEVNATSLTPRRQQNSQCIACDYSRSALDRTNRLTLEVLYDLPYFKHSSYLMKNVVGNWQIVPVYTYESPEYATVLSGDNANLNGDSASAIDRTMINANGVKGTGSAVQSVYSNNPALYNLCPTGTPDVPNTAIPGCTANLVGYAAVNSSAYYIQAGKGTSPNGARNTLPIRPIDNIDVTALKRVNFTERYAFQFQAEAFNVLNHAQYIPGSIDTVNTEEYANVYSFNTVTSGVFNNPGKNFNNNARTMQLTAKFIF